MGIREVRRLLPVCAVLLLVGCVSSPDVKKASAEMTVALDEYNRNLATFQSLWVAEIDKLRADMGKAIVARFVKLAISGLLDLKGEFDATWQQKFKEDGLIALSEEIEAAQKNARKFVAFVKKARVPEGESADDVLGITQTQVDALRRLAALKEGDLKKEFLEKADELERVVQGGGAMAVGDPMIRAYALAIVEWGAAKAAIPQGLKSLQNVIAALSMTHATIDGWIQTDVTIKGEQIGKLMKDHAEILGLGAEGGAK